MPMDAVGGAPPEAAASTSGAKESGKSGAVTEASNQQGGSLDSVSVMTFSLLQATTASAESAAFAEGVSTATPDAEALPSGQQEDSATTDDSKGGNAGGDSGNNSSSSDSGAYNESQTQESSAGAAALLTQDTMQSSNLMSENAQITAQTGIEEGEAAAQEQQTLGVTSAKDEQSAAITAADGAIAQASISGLTSMATLGMGPTSSAAESKGFQDTQNSLKTSNKKSTMTPPNEAQKPKPENPTNLEITGASNKDASTDTRPKKEDDAADKPTPSSAAPSTTPKTEASFTDTEASANTKKQIEADQKTLAKFGKLDDEGGDLKGRTDRAIKGYKNVPSMPEADQVKLNATSQSQLSMISNRDSAATGSSNITKQTMDAVGGMGGTLIAQNANIDAASQTATAKELSAEAGNVAYAQSVAQGIVGIATSQISNAQSLMSGAISTSQASAVKT
ncbi:MAG: hypothetical protein V4489_09570 [Chlamydiota bacterium]